ncbi:UNVERIFIED_CONTAM: hypothetical protein FKN15_030741 [Acipenser sinensis]
MELLEQEEVEEPLPEAGVSFRGPVRALQVSITHTVYPGQAEKERYWVGEVQERRLSTGIAELGVVREMLWEPTAEIWRSVGEQEHQLHYMNRECYRLE